MFDDLISTSGTDFDRDNAIAALCATGCVEVRAGKFVRCTSRTFLPAGKDLSRITRIGRVGAALHSTIVHNLLRSAKEPTYFERTMVSDFSLSDYGRDVMLAQLRVDGEDFIDSMDKWVSTKAADQIDEAGQRYGIAAFFFEDKRQPAGLASVPEALRAFASADSVN